ncbi:ABC transporter permease [Phytoactinopolyspora limicola]|uniref:ABC transporter permease n=1 Tax=Phytoactinopolyspora limicola TaxID=2715536 RepID=UPI00140B8F63|nr:ABC transporter permease [Phytoactinopolyspora limicola]
MADQDTRMGGNRWAPGRTEWPTLPRPGLVRAEWVKMWSLRSSAWTLGATVAAAVGLALLLAASSRDHTSVDGRFDPLFYSFYGLTLAQLALVVFTIMVVAGEYSTGTIRPSLAALPRRGHFYAAKIAATVPILVATSLVAALGGFAAAQAALGSRGVSITTPGSGRAIVGATLYLVLISMFAFGVAMMLRSTVRALAILLPMLFLGSQGLGNMPGLRPVTQFLPDQAGLLIMHIVGSPDDPAFARAYGPWAGMAILTAWTCIAVVGGWLVLRRTDV